MSDTAPPNPPRRLAAIVAADVVGYSRLIGADEAGTLAALRSLRAQVIDPRVAEFGGRLVKTMGDGLLLEFPSVVNAVKCSMAIQEAMAARNAAPGEAPRLTFRVGINLGDIVIDGTDIHGDGVNVAARLEGACEPGGLALSGVARESLGRLVEAVFEDAGPQEFKNIDRPIRVWRWKPAGAPAVAEASETGPAAPGPAPADLPSIAVLPFDNMGGDPEQEVFCDGLVEDVITTLSKLAGLRVIARNSTFVYKGRAVDLRQAGRELGASHVLEGSVRKGGNRVRVTAQLINARDGAHVWAERYDRLLDDIFAIQDEITLAIATEMQVRLTEGEQARLHYTTASNVEAWTHWVRGLAHHRRAVTKEAQGAALDCWEKALALDPESAPLNAKVGFLHSVNARFGWWDDRETAAAKARAHADRALGLDPDNADAFITRGMLHMLAREFDDAVACARRAVDLAPNSADVAELASFILTPCGFPDEAAAQSRKAMTLNPNYPPVYLGQLGNACHMAGNIDEAIAAFTEYGVRSPGFGLVDLVVIHHRAGRPDAAARAARELLAARPGFSVADWERTQIRRDTARLEEDLAALRAAGLPE